MTIIFDFNRTLYDPETDSAVEGAREALNMCRMRGFAMHLVSRREPGRPEALIELGMDRYFESITFVDDKKHAIEELVSAAETSAYVVGDHLFSEIRAGNKAGARTIWLKRGKFSELEPEGPDDVPWKTIEHLDELRELMS